MGATACGCGVCCLVPDCLPSTHARTQARTHTGMHARTHVARVVFGLQLNARDSDSAKCVRKIHDRRSLHIRSVPYIKCGTVENCERERECVCGCAGVCVLCFVMRRERGGLGVGSSVQIMYVRERLFVCARASVRACVFASDFTPVWLLSARSVVFVCACVSV